jgi:hypothetical protein
MVWSQIIFDIVIIYLHRLTQLLMKQIWSQVWFVLDGVGAWEKYGSRPTFSTPD